MLFAFVHQGGYDGKPRRDDERDCADLYNTGLEANLGAAEDVVQDGIVGMHVGAFLLVLTVSALEQAPKFLSAFVPVNTGFGVFKAMFLKTHGKRREALQCCN